MAILGIILGTLAHMTIAFLYMYFGSKLISNIFNIQQVYSSLICLILMIGHWFLFNGCCIVYIVDKPIAHAFGAVDYMSGHTFDKTPIYKFINNIKIFIS